MNACPNLLTFVLLVQIILFSTSITISAEVTGDDKKQSILEIIPEYYLDIDVRWMALPKNKYFWERYFFENNFTTEFALFSVKKNFLTFFQFEENSGMGRSFEGVVFDPRDINYAVNPVLEYRLPFRINIQTGLDHRCFHEIDRQETPTVYWNKPFISVFSANTRTTEMRKQMTASSISVIDRLAWSAGWGHFIRSFYGLVDPITMMSYDPGYYNDFIIKARYVFYNYRSVLFSVNDLTWLCQSRNKHLYWSQVTGADCDYRAKGFGARIFVTYIRDYLPLRMSKDRLLQIGLSFYK